MKGYLLLIFALCLLVFPSARGGNGPVRGATDSLERALAREKVPAARVKQLLALSAQWEFTDNHRAIGYAKKSYDLALETSDDTGCFNALMQLARLYYLLSDLNRAMDYAQKGYELAEAMNAQEELARALDGIGVIYYEIGNENKSSDCFYSSLKIYEKLNDKVGLGQSYCRIGTLYFKQKESDKAIGYYARSMNLAREIRDAEGIASNLSNLAMVHTEERRYDTALRYLTEALAINQKQGNLQLVGSNYLSIGNVYLKMGRHREAMEYAEKAEELFGKSGNQLRMAKARITKGEVLLARKMYDQSLGEAHKALDSSSRNGYKEIAYTAASLLHKIYLAKNDSGAAYRYNLLENQWKDSLALGENKKTLARLEMQYQFEKREQHLILQKQRRDFFIALLAVTVVFVVILIFLLRSQYRLREKKSTLERQTLQKDLEFKRKELTINVMSLMKKNEILTEITRKILKVESEVTQEDVKATLKKVAKDLQKSTEDEIYKEFSLRFKEVHADFYDALLRRYPTLTPSELRLSAFLRLNMTTKEIAELTGQQVSSLENARYRLRQKLGLTSSDTNLVTFLAQIS